MPDREVAVGATRDNLLQQIENLKRRRAELKAALGIRTRGQHKNFMLRLNKRGGRPAAHYDPDVVRELVVTGESINRINTELRKLRDTEGAVVFDEVSDVTPEMFA